MKKGFVLLYVCVLYLSITIIIFSITLYVSYIQKQELALVVGLEQDFLDGLHCLETVVVYKILRPTFSKGESIYVRGNKCILDALQDENISSVFSVKYYGQFESMGISGTYNRNNKQLVDIRFTDL